MSGTTRDQRSTPLARSCAAPHACPRPLRLEVLAHARYFDGLDRAALAHIEARMRVSGYHKGQPIYQAGELATHLFVLASGRVKLVRPANGADVLIDVIAPGALFGTLTTLGEPRYPDSAEALTVSCALRIGAEEFRAVLGAHPQVALAVLDDVTGRLERAHEAVRVLSTGTVEQRVAATLLTLADKLGEPRREGILLQLPLTRADLAAMTGTTTESVSRVMSRLRQQGIVASGRRWTTVLDRVRLDRLAGR